MKVNAMGKDHNQNNQDFASQKIKLCIIDDDKDYIASIKDVLHTNKRIYFYGNYLDGKQFMESVQHTPFLPDVCLVDIMLGNISGMDVAQFIKEKYPQIHVVIMTAYPKMETMIQAKNMGADYIVKGPRIRDLLEKLIVSLKPNQTENFISLEKDSNMGFDLIELALKIKSSQEKLHKLSDNQYRILKLRKEGKTLQEIAELLNIKKETVHTHINRALKKLELPNILDVILKDDPNKDEPN